MSHFTLTPAYGRDYKSKAAVLKDWKADKDFMMVGFHGNGICNRRDLRKTSPHMDVNIRYQRLTKVLVIEPTG